MTKNDSISDKNDIINKNYKKDTMKYKNNNKNDHINIKKGKKRQKQHYSCI